MAVGYKIDKVETTYNIEVEATPFHSVVFMTKADDLTQVIAEVDYTNPDDLHDALLASPTVDGGDIIDFLP